MANLTESRDPECTCVEECLLPVHNDLEGKPRLTSESGMASYPRGARCSKSGTDKEDWQRGRYEHVGGELDSKG